MIDMTGRCCQRLYPDHEIAIRPHVCRRIAQHLGRHECTCGHRWTAQPTRSVTY